MGHNKTGKLLDSGRLAGKIREPVECGRLAIAGQMIEQKGLVGLVCVASFTR